MIFCPIAQVVSKNVETIRTTGTISSFYMIVSIAPKATDAGSSEMSLAQGGYSWEFLVGVCRPGLQILTLFQTKKCHFAHPFSDQTSFSSPEPVVSWAEWLWGRECYKLSRVALGTRMTRPLKSIPVFRPFRPALQTEIMSSLLRIERKQKILQIHLKLEYFSVFLTHLDLKR